MTTQNHFGPFAAGAAPSDGGPMTTTSAAVTAMVTATVGTDRPNQQQYHEEQQQQHQPTLQELQQTDTQSQTSTPDYQDQLQQLVKDAATPSDLLTFTDVSSDISHLRFDPDKPQADPILDSHSRPTSRSSLSSRYQPQAQTQTQSQTSASAIRKTSPGLAARLKALGFGASKRTASPAAPLPNESIGRLDEHQLRELDQKHQAASSNSVIVRRGRPWKGAGAIARSRSSNHPDRPKYLQLPESYSANAIDSQSDSDLEPSPCLPEIRTPEPLAMDTQKYRLPDHTNGNGTKATLDIRREHLERDAPSLTLQEDQDTPPPPPPKDTPPVVTPPATSESNEFNPDLGSYFTPGHTRPGSIYTLSRASFANQLAQLTSLQLPDAESLSSKVSAIPTAQVASKALINAADQIKSWISKASEVISGLDSDDDVEWSAAGGREGLAEVENAITRFEELINVYVGAIEELQARKDIASVSTDDLTRAVTQMESILTEWARIRNTLQNVRAQVEIAMEWEELWNNVLGDIQGEMDELSRLVFEMEERRHKSIAAAAGGDNVDIGDLETIVEDTPTQASRLQAASNRLSIPAFPMSPGSPVTPSLSQDDSSLLALFARMQPLRASLDFLPMRLSVFQARAEHAFPTACDELEMRRTGLDGNYKKLEKDAESLRKELGEDRWVIVFRGAGRQAQKMHESVERSLVKLKEAIDAGMHLTNPPSLTKKLESYEAKKTHYGPAIERVLSIIDRGVKDRLTVNGEILRLHLDLEARWASLKDQIKEMDALAEEIQSDRRSQQLRDSVSSMLSNDRSTLGSGHDTPGSSPPSSVIMSSLGMEPYTPGSHQPKTRSSSVHSNVPSNRRQSSLPPPSTGVKAGVSRLSTVPSSSATTPVPASKIQRPSSTLGNRPKWNGSTNTSGIDTGHNFKPLSLTTPSPYSKRSPMTQRSATSLTPGSASASKLPTFRNPLGRATTETPRIDETPTRSGHSRLSFRERLASPNAQTKALPKPRLAPPSSSTGSSNRRASFQPPRSTSAMEDSHSSRPASSLASSSSRSRNLPQSRVVGDQSTGRASPQALTASRLAMRRKDPQPKDSRPVWKP